jgi:hypothetical protein
LHHNQMLGFMLKALRDMAIQGTSAKHMLDYLRQRAFDDTYMPFQYMGAAFKQRNFFLYANPSSGFTEETERLWRERILLRRPEWETERLPELMRLRDYYSFLQFAEEQQAVVIVCGCNPASGQWIGRPGVRCYDGLLPIPSRWTAPNQGLLAADPADQRLQDILNAFDKPLSYAAYVEQLAHAGLQVMNETTGYVVQDAMGNRLHDSYRLHGVYDAKSSEPRWTQKAGEQLRAALNRHLGSELVRWGPHDDWVFRNEKGVAGPWYGPHVPAIAFYPDQTLKNILETDALAAIFYLHRERWTELYPHHSAKAS